MSINENHKENLIKNINNFILKYSNKLDEFTKEVFLKDKNCITKKEIYNNFSKTNLVINYKNLDQTIFNYIINCTVNETIFFLNQNEEFFLNLLIFKTPIFISY